MSDYNCSICNRTKHTSDLEVRKIKGVEELVCEGCIEWNEVGRYL